MSQLELEMISFRSKGEFERYTKWIDEKRDEGKIIELKKSEVPLQIIERFVQDHTTRYFQIPGESTYWVMGGPGDYWHGGISPAKLETAES